MSNFVEAFRSRRITEELDAVYASEVGVDPALDQMQLLSLPSEKW